MGSKQFVFTIFKKDFSPSKAEECDGMSYFIGQRERCPKTHRLHWQCYAQFDKVVRGSVIQKWCGEKCHYEKSLLRNAEAARKYCMKDETFDGERYEWGSFKDGARKKKDVVLMNNEDKIGVSHDQWITVNTEFIDKLLDNVPWPEEETEVEDYGDVDEDEQFKIEDHLPHK